MASKAKPKRTTAKPVAQTVATPQAGLFRRRHRRRALDYYEPRTTMALRRYARRTDNEDLLAALDDPDFRRSANAAIIGIAEDEGVEVDSDRPFLDWIMGILDALQPVIIKVITQLLEGFLSGGGA